METRRWTDVRERVAQSRSVTRARPHETQSPDTTARERRARIIASLSIAVTASAAVDALWWLHQPRLLTGPIDVVGGISHLCQLRLHSVV